MTKNQKKLDRLAKRKEGNSYYVKLINLRTGYSKLVSREKAFTVIHGVFDTISMQRTKRNKDEYKIMDI